MIPDPLYATIRRRTLLSRPKLDSLYRLATGLADVPGAFAELGVYRGGVLRLLCDAANHGRDVYGFDTFNGLPSPDAELDRHKAGEFGGVTVAEVQEFCPDSALVPGLFPASAYFLDGQEFALVHLDADLYTSTRDALAWFGARMAPGGAIVLDDWDWPWCPGVRKAVDETMYRGAITAPNQLTIRF
jgi:O-methyltransferase